MERESHQPQLDLTIRHRQNGKLSDQVATSTNYIWSTQRHCVAHLNGNAVNSVMLETYASTMNNLVHAVDTTTAVPLAETINIPFFSPRTS